MYIYERDGQIVKRKPICTGKRCVQGRRVRWWTWMKIWSGWNLPSYTSGSGRTLQGTHAGPVSLPEQHNKYYEKHSTGQDGSLLGPTLYCKGQQGSKQGEDRKIQHETKPCRPQASGSNRPTQQPQGKALSMSSHPLSPSRLYPRGTLHAE